MVASRIMVSEKSRRTAGFELAEMELRDQRPKSCRHIAVIPSGEPIERNVDCVCFACKVLIVEIDVSTNRLKQNIFYRMVWIRDCTGAIRLIRCNKTLS